MFHDCKLIYPHFIGETVSLFYSQLFDYILAKERSIYFNKGFKDAFILTFYKGKRITAKEGIDITSED